MARNAAPAAVHHLKGSYKKDPQRENKDAPEVGDISDKEPPEYFNERQTFYWNDLIQRSPAGVLSDGDYYVLALGAVLLNEMEEKKGSLGNERIGKLISVLSKLGMTPSDRSGLKVDKKKKNAFDDV